MPYSLKNFNFKCLNLWGKLATIQIHQYRLEELKREFDILRVA